MATASQARRGTRTHSIPAAAAVMSEKVWQHIASCFGVPEEALSTRCGGEGVKIFFGMVKPVR